MARAKLNQAQKRVPVKRKPGRDRLASTGLPATQQRYKGSKKQHKAESCVVMASIAFKAMTETHETRQIGQRRRGKGRGECERKDRTRGKVNKGDRTERRGDSGEQDERIGK